MTSAADALLRQQVDDQTFAFLHALLASEGLSVSTAEAAVGLAPGAGARLLRKANVRHVLGELLRERKERHEDVRSSVILMLWRMACADPRQAWSEDGAQLSPHELPDELAAVLEEVSPVLGEGGCVVAYKYKFAKKTAILDMLLRHFDEPKALDKRGGGPVAQVIFRGVVNAPDESEGTE